MLRLAAWRNWQTQETQNLPGVTPRVGSSHSAATTPTRLVWLPAVVLSLRAPAFGLALEVDSLRRHQLIHSLCRRYGVAADERVVGRGRVTWG